LDEKYNRIEFLKEVLLSSLESNVQLETYEVAAVLNDCIKILNED
jgi:protein-arginine kinase activator protein McsA